MAKFPILVKSYKTSLVALSASVMLAGCGAHRDGALSENQKKDIEQLMAGSHSSSRAEVAATVALLYKGDYKEASSYVNTALMDDPKNAALHYLNGFAYQLMSERGHGDYMDFAVQGYTTALQLDPTIWQASEQIGRIMLAQKRYKVAQEAFADALLYNPENADAYHNLAIASYYSRDVSRALAYARVAVEKDPNNIDYLRSAALIASAAQEPEMAQTYFERYKVEEPDTAQEKYLERRMKEWNHAYASGQIDRMITTHKKEEAKRIEDEKKQKKLAEARQKEYDNYLRSQYEFASEQLQAPAVAAPQAQSMQLTAPPAGAAGEQITAPPVGAEPITSPDLAAPVIQAPVYGQAPAAPPLAPPVAAPVPEPDPMVLLDGVVLRVSEEGRTQKGSNILDNLAIAATLRNTSNKNITKNFGAPATNVDNINRFRQFDLGNLTAANVVGPLTYSLNFANAFRQHVEVIGRPTLAVTLGKEGDFYSGDDRYLPIRGDRGGNVEKIPVGIGLTVTPLSIEGDTVTLKVAMQGRSVLAEPVTTAANTSVVDQFLVLASSYVKTEIKAKIGETIVLAGIKLRSDVQDKGGFPGLQDVPLVQYFFSNEQTTSQRRTVIYMLTVRGYGKDLEEVRNTLEKEEINSPAVSELDERHYNWFRPRSNTLSMLRTLGPVYREFRTGDLSPVRWVMTDSGVQQTLQASAFLWY